MITMHTARTNLENLIVEERAKQVSPDRNEAETRFHIIDYIIEHCLDWSRSEIEVERHERGKFTDYELGSPRIAILEAKREGIVFEIPAGTNKLKIDMPSLCAMSPEAKEAIVQAQEYCGKRGVPIGIVSNGHQFIAFLASRQDGISVLDADAVLFKSLDHLLEKFSVAWQLLSKEGLKEKNIVRYLSTGENVIPHKLSARLVDFPKIRYASDIQATLKQLSELLIQDVLETKEVEALFFKECYCESGALSKYALLSRNILDARYASMFSTSEPHPHTASVKNKKKDTFASDVIAEALSRRPIVLIGDVGVGKTSFVKNLVYNSAYEEFKNSLYIYIDLGSKGALTADLKTFVLEEIERQLFSVYDVDLHEDGFVRGVYHQEISRFANSVWGRAYKDDPVKYEEALLTDLSKKLGSNDQHLKASILHISKARKKQIIIFLDNADQRDFLIQQDAFIISQELANSWAATVFIAVRPQTFYKSKRSGALTAYPHKIFTISPPRVDVVIDKRLKFALDMAEGQIPLETLDFVRVNARSLACFLKALIVSLDQSEALQEFLVNITGGNIRAVIEFVTGFIGSPNVDAEKIIKHMEEQGSYAVPIHEFTKSALLGDFSHYNADTSLAMNVFDVSSPDRREHFLVLIMLSFLNNDGPHKDRDGFCATAKLVGEMQNFGFTNNQVEVALRKTTNKKLIETSQRLTFEEDESGLIGEMPSSFRITSVGAYHLKRWCGTFTYLDAMVFDTPIFDGDAFNSMLRKVESLRIEDRYDRSIIFKSYLLRVWRDFSSPPTYFNFSDYVQQENSTFERVRAAIVKNGAKDSGF